MTSSHLVPLLLVAAASGGLSSCHAIPSYATSAFLPHKDSVVLRVVLPQRQDPEIYESIATRELERFLRRQPAGMLPLYEARVEFHHHADSQEPYAVSLCHLPTAGRPASERKPFRWTLYIY